MNLKGKAELNQELLLEANRLFPTLRQASHDCKNIGGEWSITTVLLRRWFTDGNAIIEQELIIGSNKIEALPHEEQFTSVGKVEHCHAYARDIRHIADPELEEVLEHRKTIAELEGALAKEAAKVKQLYEALRAVAFYEDKQENWLCFDPAHCLVSDEKHPDCIIANKALGKVGQSE